MNTKLLTIRKKRHLKIRKKIIGTTEIPRLNIFRSNTKLFVQIIDDSKHVTLLSASSNELSGKKILNNVENAKKLGILFGKKAIKANFNKVVFDRGGYAFHGRVEAFVEGCKESGLKF